MFSVTSLFDYELRLRPNVWSPCCSMSRIVVSVLLYVTYSGSLLKHQEFAGGDTCNFKNETRRLFLVLVVASDVLRHLHLAQSGIFDVLN